MLQLWLASVYFLSQSTAQQEPCKPILLMIFPVGKVAIHEPGNSERGTVVPMHMVSEDGWLRAELAVRPGHLSSLPQPSGPTPTCHTEQCLEERALELSADGEIKGAGRLLTTHHL